MTAEPVVPRDRGDEGRRVTTTALGLSSPFVSGGCGTLRAALLFPPAANLEGIKPAPGEASPILERAREQFAVFSNRLAAAGVKTATLDDPALSPWGADGAVMFADGAFLMRPSDVRARTALPALEAFFKDNGIPVIGRIDAPGLLDGGDVLLAGKTLFVGVLEPRRAEVGLSQVPRGNALGRQQLANYAQSKGFNVVEVALAAEARRLRSVAALVDDRTVTLAAGLADAGAFEGFERIDVPRGEDSAAGPLVLAPRRVLQNLRFREALPLMRKKKLIVDAIDVWEFGKLGVTPGSMVLALRRD